MANKLITMCAYNRPHYLYKVLESLSKCVGIGDYRLIICLEPGDKAVKQMCERIDFCQSEIVINPTVLGVRDNTYQALSLGFEQADFVIHLEDDVRSARDALSFFEHCRWVYADNSDIYTVTGYNGPAYDWAGDWNHDEPGYGDTGYKAIVDYVESEYYLLRRLQWFHTSGWATWRNRWSEPNGMRDNWEQHISAWGPRVNTALRGNRSQIYPVLARTQNIGAQGVHVTGRGWFYRYIHNASWAGALGLLPNIYHE